MYFIIRTIQTIAWPIRSLYYMITQYTPGLSKLPSLSVQMRIALMTFLFLLVVYAAAVVSYWFAKIGDTAEKKFLIWVGLAVLIFVIPTIVFYLVKYLMMKEESRFPDIDRVWDAGLEECERNGIFITEVPVFLVQGARDNRTATQLMKATQLPLTVSYPPQEDSDIVFFANSDAIFLYVNGCSCLSRLSSAPAGPSPLQVSPMGGGGAAPTGTIDASMFSAGAARPAAPADVGGTLADGFPPPEPAAPMMQPAAAGVGGTMLLPEGQGIGDFLGGSRSGAAAEVPRVPQLSSQDIVEREQKLRHVCGLLRDARKTMCPINGLITLLPFELVESAPGPIQTAAQKDLALLREELLVRCSNTVLITHLDREEGFQELVKRVGEERSREFRFGKGCELWNAPEGARLEATAAHAVGAFEDWIYMLFQEENALKHRYNSRLFMLLCRIRGKFAENLRAVLSRGFGFDPQTEPHLAYEQFLFGGCYFAATGSDASRQAFVKSVFLKGIQQEGELEWAPEARNRDTQLQFAANLFALLGLAAVLAIIGLVIYGVMKQNPA
ncbi:MAG: type VI secretion protein IcmF/TssM N-terminal domain-containing protein [Pirellulaceae bacterium]